MRFAIADDVVASHILGVIMVMAMHVHPYIAVVLIEAFLKIEIDSKYIINYFNCNMIPRIAAANQFRRNILILLFFKLA